MDTPHHVYGNSLNRIFYIHFAGRECLYKEETRSDDSHRHSTEQQWQQQKKNSELIVGHNWNEKTVNPFH